MGKRSSRHKQVVDALHNEHLQTALKRAVDAYKNARSAAMEGFDLARAQERVRFVKARSIAEMGELFAKFKEEAERVGAIVHEAEDGAEVAEIVRRIAVQRGVELIVKSKSMLTEEIELNRRLEEAHLKVVETDLGEWIVQLAKEKPSHFTAPALHKTREQVAELFSAVTGEDQEADVAKLVEVARRQLRQTFVDAQMGISGANIAIAETGTIVIVANEGNDRLVTTLPPIHVAIVGYEKLVESMSDAFDILNVLSKSATGQKQTAYVSFITGPSRTTDIEKTLALGVHGPKELHIIFVDSGRKALAADAELREALYCIKCGACLNMCPVYRSIGGHAFGNAYMGGIGAVVTAYHRSLNDAQESVELCAGCGYCTGICPSKIDVPRMVLALKSRLVDKYGLSTSEMLPMSVLRRPRVFRSLLQMARAAQWLMVDDNGDLRRIPFLRGENAPILPGLAPKFLRDCLPELNTGAGTVVALYAGCVLDFVYPEVGRAIWDVLTKSDVSVVFPKSQCCCGAPALYLGDLETARSLMIENLNALESARPDFIVTGCPTCAVMLREHAPRVLAGSEYEKRTEALGAKVMDFSQYVIEVLDFRPGAQREGSATYHDPCHQVRGLNSSAYSREVLKRCGVELVEMNEPDQCCGFAGTYSLKNPEISYAILNRKIADIASTGTSTVYTDCPGCIMQIRGGVKRSAAGIDVCHTALLAAALMEG